MTCSPWSGIESSHLSQQLGILRRAGLVTTRKEGVSVIYSLVDPTLAELLAVAKRLLISSLVQHRGSPRRPAGGATMNGLPHGAHRCGPLPASCPRRADYAGLRDTWRADVVAGVTVGVVALPLALAFGITTGLGAEAGLMTAIVAGIVAASSAGRTCRSPGPPGP